MGGELGKDGTLKKIIYLNQYREALAILATKGLRPSLYRLARRVINTNAPHPYMQILPSEVEA